jgi:hypothetical protein
LLQQLKVPCYQKYLLLKLEEVLVLEEGIQEAYIIHRLHMEVKLGIHTEVQVHKVHTLVQVRVHKVHIEVQGRKDHTLVLVQVHKVQVRTQDQVHKVDNHSLGRDRHYSGRHQQEH